MNIKTYTAFLPLTSRYSLTKNLHLKHCVTFESSDKTGKEIKLILTFFWEYDSLKSTQ